MIKKNLFVSLGVAALALAIAVPAALSHGPKGDREGWKDRRGEHLAEKLGLDDKQKANLEQLRVDHLDDVKSIREQIGQKREAIRALGELRAVEAVPEMADAIEGLGEWNNLLLVMALIRMGPACVPAIGALLADTGARSPAMLKGLLQVTSRLGVAAEPAIIRALAAHDDMEVRVEAVRVLGTIEPDPRSGDVCLAAMDDAQWPVRAIAASSLGRLRDERAVARLSQAMGDPAYWVRHHVAEAMASLGEPGAGALRRALNDGNPFVRDMAAQALYMHAIPEAGPA